MSLKYQFSQWFRGCCQLSLLCSSAFLVLATPTIAGLPGSKLLAQYAPSQDLDAASFYQQGVMRYNRKDLLGAENAFRQALQRDPNLAVARNYLGNIMLQQNRLDSAVLEYSEAIKINPNLGEGYYNLGLALHQLGQPEAAITAYRQALLIDPAMASAQYNLGLVLYKKEQIADAIAAFQQAINLDGSNANAYFNLGVALQQQAQTTEAIAAYRQGLQLDPNNTAAYNNMGSLLAIQGQSQQAIATYLEAIRRTPNNATAYYNLGVTWYNQGEFKKANSAFKRASNQYRDLGNIAEANKVELLMQQIALGQSSAQVSQTTTNVIVPVVRKQIIIVPQTPAQKPSNSGEVPVSVEQQPYFHEEMPNLPPTPLGTPVN